MSRALAGSVVSLLLACGGAPQGDVGSGDIHGGERRWRIENRSDETVCYVQLDAERASFTRDLLGAGELIAPGASRSFPFTAPGSDGPQEGTVRIFDCNKRVLFQRALPLTTPAVITFRP